jgi:NO-binding membrane sensor protein with MHYT domain
MIHHHYNTVLVILSYIVSVLGSFTALKLTAELRQTRDRRQRVVSLVVAGAVMGIGAIWAMHFIAMLACRMPVPVSYGIGLTALSALVAVLACILGLALTGFGSPSLPNMVTSGTYMGVGVAGMHYMGMAAMNMPAQTHYRMGVVALSVVVAMVASIAALWLAFQRRGTLQTLFGALVMGLAVCGMHYTGMAAARFVPVAHVGGAARHGLDHTSLGMIVFAIIVVLLGAVLSMAIVREQRRIVTA